MRRTAAVSLLFFLFAGSAAWAQTTTSSTAPTSPTSSTTTTTTAGGTNAPPAASLASAAGRVAGLRGSYCWRRPDAPTAICADTFFLDPTDVLPVRQGEMLTLAFDTTASPSSISLQRFERPNGPELGGLNPPAANPSRFRADLPAGVWILVAFTQWAQGDATYFFKVDVRSPAGSPHPAPPAKPTPAAPHFTG